MALNGSLDKWCESRVDRRFKCKTPNSQVNGGYVSQIYVRPGNGDIDLKYQSVKCAACHAFTDNITNNRSYCEQGTHSDAWRTDYKSATLKEGHCYEIARNNTSGDILDYKEISCGSGNDAPQNTPDCVQPTPGAAGTTCTSLGGTCVRAETCDWRKHLGYRNLGAQDCPNSTDPADGSIMCCKPPDLPQNKTFALTIYQKGTDGNPATSDACWTASFSKRSVDADNIRRGNFTPTELLKYSCEGDIKGSDNVTSLVSKLKNESDKAMQVAWQTNYCDAEKKAGDGKATCDELKARRIDTQWDTIQPGETYNCEWSPKPNRSDEDAPKCNTINAATILATLGVVNESPNLVERIDLKVCEKDTANCEQISKSVNLDEKQTINLEQEIKSINDKFLNSDKKYSLTIRINYDDGTATDLPVKTILVDNPINYKVTVSDEGKVQTSINTEQEQGDCDFDGVISSQDLAFMLSNFGTDACQSYGEEINAGLISLGYKWLGTSVE